MVPELPNPLPFETWIVRLREDCAREDNLSVFVALGEIWLRMLWELGIPPSVQGIVQPKRMRVSWHDGHG